MALRLVAYVRLNTLRYGPGDEEAFAKVADAKVIASLKKRGILVEATGPAPVIEEPAPVKKPAAKKPVAKKAKPAAKSEGK